MKKTLVLLLALSLLLWGCTAMQPLKKQYTATYLTLFDTVTTVIGSAETEAEFQKQVQKIHDDLFHYHQLFDIYKDYDGISNLKTVNDCAGIRPVKVDTAIIDLLKACREYYDLTGGKVNAAMGSVLRLWHEARTDSLTDPSNAVLPSQAALEAAAEHISFDNILIDEAASTVFITDPHTHLDVGAIAKGWAVQKVAEAAPKGILISVGGNVCATGPKDDDGTPWIIGIQDPADAQKFLHTIRLSAGSVVTSGDYQRSFTVGGKSYHHIIDPDTRMPSAYWRSVTVVCEDSGLADALSTALFLMPLEKGMALAQQCGAQALWVDASGAEHMTSSFREMVPS